jgi:hypothetical protein
MLEWKPTRSLEVLRREVGVSVKAVKAALSQGGGIGDARAAEAPAIDLSLREISQSLAPATWLSYVRKNQLAKKGASILHTKGGLSSSPFYRKKGAQTLAIDQARQQRTGLTMDAQGERQQSLGSANNQERRRRRRRIRVPVVQFGRSALRYGVGAPVRSAAKVLSHVLVSPVRSTSKAVARRRMRRRTRTEGLDLDKRQRQWASDKRFPRQLSHPSSADETASRLGRGTAAGGSGTQELAAIGNRYAAVCVKLYDFAMYLNRDSLQRSTSMKSRYTGKHLHEVVSSSKYYDDIVRDKGTELSVVMVTARNIPLKLISSEYDKILRRRVQKVGGSEQDDPGVSKVLSIFSEDRFPAQCLEGSSIKKGTVLTFAKDRDTLSAAANGMSLGHVTNAHVCSAFFDMYMGTEPVHEGARIDLGISAIDMMYNKK